ncbi:hypothetical protein HAX54_026184 [Datura stramonium]|uniref:Uncharacterized protein n=1 Tax=Datura stramonium TaxID=4076 RepID=A0ABS8V0R4_DATST|nr:hypothetical protein [Datura stramonium]
MVHFHARGTRPSAQQQAWRGSIMHAMPCTTLSEGGTRPDARHLAPLRVGRHDVAHLERVGRRATAHSPSNKACDVALDVAATRGDAQGSQNGQKLDLLIQLGKGTSSPSHQRNSRRSVAASCALCHARHVARQAQGQMRGTHLSSAVGRRNVAHLQCVGKHTAAHSPSNKACDAALDAAATRGDVQGSQ